MIPDSDFLTSHGLMLLFKFLAFGRTLDEFNSWMTQEFRELEEGRWGSTIFEKPFTYEQVRIRVRYLQKRIKEGKITISDYDSNFNILEFNFWVSVREGDFKKFDEFLDYLPDSFKNWVVVEFK